MKRWFRYEVSAWVNDDKDVVGDRFDFMMEFDADGPKSDIYGPTRESVNAVVTEAYGYKECFRFKATRIADRIEQTTGE